MQFLKKGENFLKKAESTVEKFRKTREPDRALQKGREVQVGSYRVRVLGCVAEGGFSSVYKVKDVNTGGHFALKHVLVGDNPSTLEQVRDEARFMEQLSGHPNIVKLYAKGISGVGGGTEAFLLMELCEHSLVDIMAGMKGGQFTEEQLLSIFLAVCQAVSYMHNLAPPLTHRDLKPENVLRSRDGMWKLCDFGSATTRAQIYSTPEEMGLEEDNIRKHTTPAYRAPEMWDLYQHELINDKVDIWALGCVLYRMAYLKNPFDGDSKLQILNLNYDKYPANDKYSEDVRKLIQDILRVEPSNRPDIELLSGCVATLLARAKNQGQPLGCFPYASVGNPFAAASHPPIQATGVLQTGEGGGVESYGTSRTGGAETLPIHSGALLAGAAAAAAASASAAARQPRPGSGRAAAPPCSGGDLLGSAEGDRPLSTPVSHQSDSEGGWGAGLPVGAALGGGPAGAVGDPLLAPHQRRSAGGGSGAGDSGASSLAPSPSQSPSGARSPPAAAARCRSMEYPHRDSSGGSRLDSPLGAATAGRVGGAGSPDGSVPVRRTSGGAAPHGEAAWTEFADQGWAAAGWGISGAGGAGGGQGADAAAAAGREQPGPKRHSSWNGSDQPAASLPASASSSPPRGGGPSPPSAPYLPSSSASSPTGNLHFLQQQSASNLYRSPRPRAGGATPDAAHGRGPQRPRSANPATGAVPATALAQPGLAGGGIPAGAASNGGGASAHLAAEVEALRRQLKEATAEGSSLRAKNGALEEQVRRQAAELRDLRARLPMSAAGAPLSPPASWQADFGDIAAVGLIRGGGGGAGLHGGGRA